MKITPIARDLPPIALGTTLADGDVLTWDGATGTWVAGAAVTDHGLLTGLADDDHSAYALAYGGGEETVSAHGNMGATETFNPAAGNWHTGTFDAACTFTFTAPTNGVGCSLMLELAQDGTGGHAATLPASVVNRTELEAAQDTTASTTAFLIIWTRDGGTTWFGQWVGGGLSAADFATPAIVLGTAAAAGSAGTVIRSDATIVAFDAIAPVTQAFDDAAAAGSAAVAARRDHKHGMPAEPIAGLPHVHVAYETHTSDGSTVTFTLDQVYEPSSVTAWNRTTGHVLGVTEVAPDQATVSAAGTAADLLDFHYAASVI